jgi:hypothetical protein
VDQVAALHRVQKQLLLDREAKHESRSEVISELWSVVMTEERKTKTLVLICHRDFCRILNHVLRSEGFNDFHHGDLKMVCGSALEIRAGGETEVFVVSIEDERAERLIKILHACPIRGEAQDIFELYMVDGD